jgi:hypothetical protein
MFRQIVRSILKPYPNIEVVGEASDDTPTNEPAAADKEPAKDRKV